MTLAAIQAPPSGPPPRASVRMAFLVLPCSRCSPATSGGTRSAGGGSASLALDRSRRSRSSCWSAPAQLAAQLAALPAAGVPAARDGVHLLVVLPRCDRTRARRHLADDDRGGRDRSLLLRGGAAARLRDGAAVHPRPVVAVRAGGRRVRAAPRAAVLGRLRQAPTICRCCCTGRATSCSRCSTAGASRASSATHRRWPFMALLAAIVFTDPAGPGAMTRAGAASCGSRSRGLTMLLTRSATITVALVSWRHRRRCGAAPAAARADGRGFGIGIGILVVAAAGVVAPCCARPAACAARPQRGPHQPGRDLGEGDRARTAAAGRRMGLGQLLGPVGAAVRRPAQGQRRAGHARPQRLAGCLAAAGHPRADRVRRSRARHVWRAWILAVDRPLIDGSPSRYGALELLPLLLLVAMLVQSLAESRLLVEYAWTLLVIVAVKSKHDQMLGTGFSGRADRSCGSRG